MAEDLIRSQVAGEAPLPPGTPADPPAALERRTEPDEIVTPPRDWEAGPHAGRFLIAYAALGLILGAAVIGLAVGTSKSDDGNTAAWSSWQPTREGSARIREIAAHVSRNYRLPSGNELVAVIPRAPDASDPPLTTVAIDKQTLFDRESQFDAYPMTKGMLYSLCGPGTEDCSISEGQPSIDRFRLLRREALELALYTFRYVGGVDSVLAFLPPRTADATADNTQEGEQQPADALFFRRNDPLFAPLIKTPLALTLPGRPRGEVLPAKEARLIDQLTAPVLYRSTFQRLSDGQSAVALLQPYAQTG